MFIGHRYWYIVCESHQLKRKPLSRIVASFPVVVFRTLSGQVVALEDRCAHRHVPLSQGRVNNECIECPYHAWQYGIDGKLKQVPALKDISKITGNFHIKKYHCLEQDGYVWICLAEQPAIAQPLKFPYLEEPGWTTFRMKTRFAGSVETCLENFLDCPHATFVHRFWFRTPSAKPVKAVVKTLEDGAVAEYFQEPRDNSVVWWLLSKKQSQMRHTDRFIFPSTSRVDYIFSDSRHYIITSSCTPVSDNETEVYTVISFRFQPIGWFIKLFFAPLSRLIIQQDVQIISLQQENIQRFEKNSGKINFKLTQADLLLPYIRKWRQSEICDENSSQTAPPEGIEHQVDILL